MPPRTPDEIELNRIHRLIGLFAISVVFLLITWIAGRQGGPAVSVWLTGAFAVLGLASLGATQASEMYARNLMNFVALFVREGQLGFDWEDELLAKTRWQA